MAAPAPSAAAKAAYSIGLAANLKGDFPTAIRELAIACDGGVASGCFFLAGIYYQGKGVSIDRARAARFHAKSCDLGDEDGCNNVGRQYHNGDGVTQSYGQAISYYRKTLAINPVHANARASLPIAERALANAATSKLEPSLKQAYDAGIAAFGQNDFATAQRQFTTACDGRLANGCYSLGVMISRGNGGTPDKARAAKLFATACAGGNANGCYNLGLFHDDGTGVARNLTTAASYYMKACDAGSAGGCYNAGVAYDRGDGVTQSIDRALGYYRRALVIDPELAAAGKAIASAEQRRAARQ